MRTFARRLVAFVGEHGDVEGRVVLPRLEHAMIELEPVHFGADDMIVDLRRDRPSGRIDRLEAPLIRRELRLLRGHRGGAIVVHTGHALRWLKCAPVLE